ncbi:tRNA pseudouridine synthase A [Bienertia sinuspersici]
MEEQLGDSNKEQALGKRDASNSQGTSTKKKGRGPSKEVQSSTPIFLEFDDFDLPTGKWEASYGKHIGKCALKIDINVKAYPKLDEVDKKNLWEETKQKFHIDDPKGVKEKNFHMAVGARFRRFKSWLIARFITKTKAPSDDSPNAQLKPWELYEGYITEDQWKEFEAYVKSEEFKAKSEKGMEGAKNNKYRHHLGQKSYERAWEGWSKSNRIPTPTVPESSITCSAETSSTALNQKVTNRPLAWVLARQIKLPNGSWGIDPNDAPTAEIANSVLENLQKKDLMREEGKDTHEEWGIDALTMALGRMDKRGYVKGLGRGGVGLCHTKAFGKSNRKRKSSSEISFEKLEEMKASLRKEFEARLEEKLQEEMEGRLGQRVAMELNAYLSSIIPQFTSTNFPQVNRPETSASVIGVSSEVSRVLEHENLFH